MQDYKKLRVWHRAKDLSVKIIAAFPERTGRKVPGLRNQVIRAATSVAANLVEGCGRSTREDFLHFIKISLGSLNEVEGYLVTAHEAGVLGAAPYAELQRDIDLVRRMLLSLIRAVERQIAKEEGSKVAPRRVADEPNETSALSPR